MEAAPGLLWRDELKGIFFKLKKGQAPSVISKIFLSSTIFTENVQKDTGGGGGATLFLQAKNSMDLAWRNVKNQ